MNERLKAAYDWIMSKDWFTWLGHGLLGFVITLAFGPLATFVAFAYRELSDLLAWWRDDRQAYGGKGKAPPAYKPSLDNKLQDGFMDLWAPLAGAALAEILTRAI